MVPSLKGFAVGALALTVLASAGAASAAPDAKAVADSLVAAADAAGSAASYESAAANGADVVVTNFKLAQHDRVITIPSFVIAAPAPRPGGGFSSPHLTFDNGSGTTDKGRTLSWRTGLADDAVLPTAEEVKTRAAIRPFRSLKITGIELGVGGTAPPVTIEQVTSDFGEVTPGAPRAFTSRIGPIHAGIDVLNDMPNYKHVLELLGYKDFTVNIATEGGYDDKTDTLSLAAFAIDTADVGKLTLSGKFSGMSLGQIATKSDSVGTTAQAKLDNLQVSFVNTGVVERVLSMQAEASGSTRDEVIEQATAVVAVTFTLSGNIDFAEKITTAVGAFLANPKNLTFIAAPQEPVSLGKIFATALGAKETLPDLLGVDVKANQ